MKKTLSFLLLPMFLLTGCTSPVPTAGTYRQITAQEAADMMARETGYIILDVRSPQEYAAGHIPGAILIPNETIGSTAISELPDKNQLIMVYCRSGNRSKQAAEKLVRQGYTNIIEFGGIGSWTGELTRD